MIGEFAGNPAAFCLRAGVERRTVPNEVVKHSDQFGRDRDIVAVEEALALARVHQPQRWRFARSGDEQGKAIVDHRGIPNVSAKLLHIEGSEFLLEKGVPAVVTSGHLRAESHVDKQLKAPLRISTVAYRKPGPEPAPPQPSSEERRGGKK